MAYITQSILEAEHGSDKVSALVGGSSATLQRLIEDASARVRSALVIGGYSAATPESVYAADASDCPREIVSLAARVWKALAYARQDLSIPEDQLRAIDVELADIREGRVEISGVSRVTGRAPGGLLVSDADITSSSERARPQVFSRARMSGW
jgi:hypothetical protein